MSSSFHTKAQSSPPPATARVASLIVSAVPGFKVPTFEKSVSVDLRLVEGPAGAPISITSDLRGPCTSRLRAPGDPAHVDPRGTATWFIAASLVSQDADTATVDVHWERRVPRPGVLAETDMAGVRRLVLRDRARGILDFVHGVAGAPGICDSFAIALELRLRARAADVPDAGFAYDVWLVDRAGAGAAAPVRTRIEARHGIEMPYALPPITLAGGAGPVRVSVAGVVIGDARADGAVDLSVDTWQSVSGEPRSTGLGGRKRLVAAAGETIEFELPASLRSQLPPDLQHHDFALRVTTSRLW
jgi:hypothetical protein